MTNFSEQIFFPPSVVTDLKDKTKALSEKIKLEFSLFHADPGIYFIEVKLDNQPLDFTSEKRQIFSEGQIIFEKFFVYDFYFAKQQKIEIIYHKNNSTIKITVPLGYILGCLNCKLAIPLGGKIILEVKGERLLNAEDLLNVKISLKERLNPYYFTNKKIYFFITCGNKKIYRSAEIMDNGVFKPIQIPICLLQPSYTITFYNYNNEKKFCHNILTKNIKKPPSQYEVNILDGNFILTDYSEIIKKYTFFDYLKAGIQIALSIGIDFSSQNEGYNLKNHHINANGSNEFENAIYLCSNILGYYDYDQKYPAYGFGALLDDGVTRIGYPPFFNLNLLNNPEIVKIENVIRAYRNLITEKQNFLFSSQVFFAPLIREIMNNITKKNNVFEYNILLILSTGVINDLQQTIDVLVEASLLPLSVVIVGIGDGDFKNMETLDGDIFPLTSSKGKKRIRDIVQFVRFSEFKNDMEKLSMEVLAEIPRQVLEFYTIKNLKPEDIRNLTKNAKVIRRTKTNPFQGNNNNNPNQEYRIGFGDNLGKTFMNIAPAGYNPQIKSYEPNYHHPSLSDQNIIRFPKGVNINEDQNNVQEKSSVIYNDIYENGNNNI